MYMTTLIAYFFKQLIVNNREMKRFSCTYWWGICVKLMCAYAKFWHIYFYFHLHATLGAFYVCFLVNMYLSGTCICMSLRALHLHTCTCSHSLNYIFMGWISCCVLMHLFNILITLIFFYYFQGIRGHWIIPGLKESRRVIIEEGNWALSSLVLWKQIQTKKIQGRCIVFFIKKNCNCVNCFLDTYQQCFLTQYFAFTFVMNAIMTQTKKLHCTLNLNYMCNKKWVVGLSWVKRKERKTWVMNIKFQLQTTVSNFLVDIGVPVLS